MLIKNGKIWTMNQETGLDKCDLRCEAGIITELGPNLTAGPGEEVIEAEGCWVLPGFIDAHTHLGMHESGFGFEGDDTNESSDPLTPEIRALDGCNPRDVAFRRAVEAGVTMVMTGPGSANVVGGLFNAIRTFGHNIEKMCLPEVSAMKCAFGENPKRFYGRQGKKPVTRMETAALLRKQLQEAVNYLKAKEEAALKPEKYFPLDPALEHLIPVVEGKIPLKAHAHRADDILTAMRIAREFKLKMTLDHCTEGHFIVEEVKESGFPALIGPTFLPPSKVELQNKGFATVVALNAAGVRCCIITDHPVISIELLPVCAGFAYKEGLPLLEALRSITLYPAEIMGVAEQYGSLAVGKRANITIYDDNPLSNLSHCLYTIGEGKVVYAKAQAGE